MKVFIAGATGRVAHYVIDDLLAEGNTVVAGCRHPESLKETPSFKPVVMDLHASVEDLEKIIAGCDAIYFLAGSRGTDLLQTDAFGAVKLMMAAQKQKISRFIVLSSMFALEPEKWNEPGIKDITDYNIAKFFADSWLEKNTDLDWTIIQAGLLREEPETGLIEIDPEHEGPVAIPNIARVLADVLTMKNTYHQLIMVKNGTTPIQEALAKIPAAH